MKNIFKESIEVLNFSAELLSKLKEHDILLVEDLWVLTRKELKQLSFCDRDIHEFIIRLELHGLDLGKRILKN